MQRKETLEAARRAAGKPTREDWRRANTKCADRKALATELGVTARAVQNAEKRGPEAYAAFVEKHRRKMAERRVDAVATGAVVTVALAIVPGVAKAA
jgi:hypothetical protein